MTPIQLQNIVDGQCSHDERARLLQSLNDDQWRTLALALLEEQQWSKEIALFAQSTNQRDAIDSLDKSSATSSGAIVEPNRHPTAVHGSWQNFFVALAAGLLLCVGFYGGSWLRSVQDGFSTPNGEAVAVQPSNRMSGQSASGMLASGNSQAPIVMASEGNSMPVVDSSRTPYRMVLTDSTNKEAEIPIYDWDDVDPDVLAARDAYEVARINQQLRRRGYEVEVQPEYYTGKLKDGRQIVVPVRNVGIRPYGL